jgi:hypothetical protein
LVAGFASGLFNWPHGLCAAPDGTIWVTDGKKQTVMQFAPDGHLLMTLGRPGIAGNRPNEFNSPSDVLVAPNGDIFVADGQGDFPIPKTNDRRGTYVPAFILSGLFYLLVMLLSLDPALLERAWERALPGRGAAELNALLRALQMALQAPPGRPKSAWHRPVRE